MPQFPIDLGSAIPILQTSQSGPLASGWLSLSELRTELANRLGGRMDMDPVRLNLWINEAYIEMCNMLELPELWGSDEFTLTIGGWLYRVGDHVKSLTKLSWSESESGWERGRPLGKTDIVEFRRLPASLTVGIPRVWAPYSRNLVAMYPPPDEAYTIAAEFYQRPTLLTANNHYPVLPQEWIEGLLLLARAKSFSALLEFGLGAQSQNEFVAWLRAQPSPLATQQAGQSARFVPVNTERKYAVSRRRL